jgi:hypothetical protein
MMQQLKAIFGASIQPGTKSSYRSALDGPNGYFTVTADIYKFSQVWPAPFICIISWLNFVAQTLSTATALVYLSPLRTAHANQNFPFLDNDPSLLTKLRKFCTGLVRSFPPAFARSFTIITPVTLRIFLSSGVLDLSNNHNHRLFFWIMCLGCYRALRGGELLADSTESRSRQLLRSAWVPTLGPQSIDGANLVLPYDKTHQRGPVEVFFPRLDKDPTCPIALGSDFLRKSLVHDGSPSQPLFLKADGNPLTADTFLAWTRAHLQSSNQEAVHPDSLKMWRAGTATTLDLMPPDDEIEAATKFIGRWKSNAYRTYVQSRISRTVFALAKYGQQSALKILSLK